MTRRLKPFTLLTGRLNKALESYLTDIYPESRQVWFTEQVDSAESQITEVLSVIQAFNAAQGDRAGPYSSVIVLTNNELVIKVIENCLCEDSVSTEVGLVPVSVAGEPRLPRSLFAAYFIDDQGEWTSTRPS